MTDKPYLEAAVEAGLEAFDRLAVGQTTSLVSPRHLVEAIVNAAAEEIVEEADEQRGLKMRAEMRLGMLRDSLVRAARVAYKGPDETDADRLRQVIYNLERDYPVGGSHTRFAVKQILLVVIDVLDAGDRP